MQKIIKKILNMNENYIIWWTPTQQPQLMGECNFLNYNYATYCPPTAAFPNGYFFLIQALNFGQFGEVSELADNQKLIDIKPTPHPPYNPTQR